MLFASLLSMQSLMCCMFPGQTVRGRCVRRHKDHGIDGIVGLLCLVIFIGSIGWPMPSAAQGREVQGTGTQPPGVPVGTAKEPVASNIVFQRNALIGDGIHVSTADISLDWPAPNTDVTAYATVYECLAATERVGVSDPDHLMLRDTLPMSAADVLRPLPNIVTEIAKRCSAKFHPDSVPLFEYDRWIDLYLQAGRDADARRVADRRLAAVGTGQVKRMGPASDTPEIKSVAPAVRERAEVMRKLALRYLTAAPARLADALPYVREVQQLDNALPRVQRLQVAFALFNKANGAEDSALARQSASWVMAFAKGQADKERQAGSSGSIPEAIMDVYRYLTRDAALDSLRESTAAYITLQRSLMREIPLTDDRIGAKAMALDGEFRFPAKVGDVSSTSTLPAPGHVTVILAEGDLEWARSDLGAMFRRWKTRFPDLDIIYAGNTRGSFNGVEPPPPDVEAQYRRRAVQDFYNYPATIVVTNTPFWHLPDPDRRRINKPTSNQTNYGDRLWLIDREGTIVHYDTPTESAEKEFTDLIEALLHQQR